MGVSIKFSGQSAEVVVCQFGYVNIEEEENKNWISFVV